MICAFCGERPAYFVPSGPDAGRVACPDCAAICSICGERHASEPCAGRLAQDVADAMAQPAGRA